MNSRADQRFLERPIVFNCWPIWSHLRCSMISPLAVRWLPSVSSRDRGGIREIAGAVRILDEVQRAFEEVMTQEVMIRFRAPNIHDCRVLKACAEEADDMLSRIVVESVEGFINDDPARFVKEDTRERKTLLLFFLEFLVPSCLTIKLRCQTTQIGALQGIYELFVFVRGFR